MLGAFPPLAAILIIILGGFLFRYLETDAEIEERLARVLFMLRMNSTLSSDDFNALVDHLQATGRITLSSTESGLASLVEEMDTYISGGADAVAALRREWSFSGSCFFCFASATTVGYGNYTPKTDAGKLSLVAYVMVAIPLFIQAYCDISDWTLRWLKWVILRKAARNHATLAIRVMAQQNRGDGGVSGGDGGMSGGEGGLSGGGGGLSGGGGGLSGGEGGLSGGGGGLSGGEGGLSGGEGGLIGCAALLDGLAELGYDLDDAETRWDASRALGDEAQRLDIYAPFRPFIISPIHLAHTSRPYMLTLFPISPPAHQILLDNAGDSWRSAHLRRRAQDEHA